MDNKEAKKVAPEAMNDDALETVAGGSDPAQPMACKCCGATENVFIETQLCYPCQVAEITKKHNGKLPQAPSNNPEVIVSLAKGQ